MSPHFILCVLREKANEQRRGCAGVEKEMGKWWRREQHWECERLRKGAEENRGESGTGWRKKRPNSRGSPPLFTKLTAGSSSCWGEVCVSSYTNPLMLVHLVCVCGTPAEECDLAHNGYDWSWSPPAPGWMTMQSQKPEQCHIHPLNTSYCISYWNKKKEKKRMLQGIWAWFTVSVWLTFFCVQYWGGGRMQRVQSSHVSDRSFVEAGVQHLHQILIHRSWVKSSLTENTPFRWDALIHKCRSAWCCHQEEIISGCEVCGGWCR